MEDMTTRRSPGSASRGRSRPTAILRLLRAGCHHRRTTSPRSGPDKYRGPVRRRLGQVAAMKPSRGRSGRGHPAGLRAHEAARRDPGVGRMPAALKPAVARQMECTRAPRIRRHHVGRLIDGLEKLQILDDTLVFYIIGDNGASAEARSTAPSTNLLNFMGSRASNARVPRVAPRRVRRARRPTTLRGGLGARDEHAVPVSKQVASHWGARATAPSSTGRRHPARARSGRSSTRDRRRADDPRGGRAAAARLVKRRAARPIEGVSMLYSFERPAGAERHETQYSSCSATAASITRLDRGDAARAPWSALA